MSGSPTIVVTSISRPNEAMRALALGALRHGYEFIVVGDSKSPADFRLQGCRFLSLEHQRASGLRFAEICPLHSYARKNVGYLLAMAEGAPVILETDDDNYPSEPFWRKRQFRRTVPIVSEAGWVNVYRYFTNETVWPRGFPLDAIRREVPKAISVVDAECPILQGLADDNPDVDAVFRLTGRLPLTFRPDIAVALGRNSWCPFNSQNTAWHPSAYGLLYLPATCTFRMTDIWRSFVAQRIAWENGWTIMFESPSVVQERNDHDLMRDFEDEVPGYLNNRRLCEELEALPLKAGKEQISDNQRICYERMVSLGVVDRLEIELLDAWLADLELALRRADTHPCR